MAARKKQIAWLGAAAVLTLLLPLVISRVFATPSPQQGTVSFEYSSWSVNEYDGTVTITVLMTGSPTSAVSVTCSTSDGTATAGEDYTANSQVLTWQPSEAGTTKTFTIFILNDVDVESTETVNLVLSNLVNAKLGSPSTAVVNIIDDDVPCP
ncbi:MAG: hypothetical protein HY040_16775 [Planctomycetes bacterium]|nr:hypothetical protein [Planctomycetota bacterium]